MTNAEITQRLEQINQNRLTRKQQSLAAHMGNDFITIPKYSLEELQTKIYSLELLQQQGNSYVNGTLISDLIMQVQNQINENNYCLPDSQEWQYKIDWSAQASTWVWPTDQENELLRQEDEEIYNLSRQLRPE